MARNGDLLNSLPCYRADDRAYLTNRYCQYYSRPMADYYNLRNNVRFDRNWGRSAWSVPAVQQARPFDIVDENHNWQGSGMIAIPWDYWPIHYDAKHHESYHHEVPVDVANALTWANAGQCPY